LGGRSICPRCGTLVGAEAALARMQIKARSFVDTRLSALPAFGPAHFLWACAFMPVVMAPPLVSLVIAIASLRGRGGDVAKTNFEWIAIISAINLIISSLILYKYHFSPAELFGHLAGLMKDWLGKFWSILPESKPSSPRIVPI
jgi:hypothetical protein